MTRRDPISQAVLDRHHGRKVEDEFSVNLPEMNPETAKHLSDASEAVKGLVNDVIPKLVGRLNQLEEGQKKSEELAIKRDVEINNKFDALLNAIQGAASKPAKKGKSKSKEDPVDDFQNEEDDLPPAEV
jgi:hypothetical protein